MNVCVFSGNIGRDAEMRYTPNGKASASFSLAVTSGWGENKSTFWVRCQLWGARAEKLTQYLTKGKKVTVSGALNNREWTDKDGGKKMTLELTVNEIDLGPKGDDDDQGEEVW